MRIARWIVFARLPLDCERRPRRGAEQKPVASPPLLVRWLFDITVFSPE